jgi:archaellum component FlaC
VSKEYINELELSVEDLNEQVAELRRTIEQAKQMIKQQRLNQEFNDKFLKENGLWDKYVSIRTNDT